MATGLGFEAVLRLPFDAAIERVTEALKAEGFGVLTRIDVHDTLRKKIGEWRRPARIADGKLASADDHLVQMEHIVADAHADVREYILNLRTTPSGEKSFFSDCGITWMDFTRTTASGLRYPFAQA